MSCLFCAIIAGDIPSRRVYEDELAVALLDINPLKPGHTLVVPRRHSEDVLATRGGLAEISAALVATGRLLRERLGSDGMNILTNVGAVSGQDVFHFHVHLIPRYADDAGMGALLRRVPGIDLDAVHAAIIGR